MATNYQTNNAKVLALNALMALAPKLMLVTSSYTPNPDHVNVSSASAAEITASGYTGGYGGGGRKTLASLSVVKDDANDRAYITCDPVVWTAVGATGTSPAYGLIIQETGGSDATP